MDTRMPLRPLCIRTMGGGSPRHHSTKPDAYGMPSRGNPWCHLSGTESGSPASRCREMAAVLLRPRLTRRRESGMPQPAGSSCSSTDIRKRCFRRFLSDGARVVTASLDRSACVWDTSSGKQILLLQGHREPVENAFFSPDGRQIVTSSNDKTARIWDAATGQQLMVFSGHTDVVERADYFADGKRIVTVSDDKTARIWDVTTGREMLVLRGHSDSIAGVGTSRDGKLVVTASTDRTARIGTPQQGGNSWC